MTAPPPSGFFDPFHPDQSIRDPIVDKSKRQFFGGPNGESHEVPVADGDGDETAGVDIPGEANGDATRRSILPVVGQGTISVSSDASKLLSFSAWTDLMGGPTLRLLVGVSEVHLFFENDTGVQQKIPFIPLKGKEACFLSPAAAGKTTYWLSVDDNNGCIRYGKYYTNKAMTLLEANLKHENKGGVMVWTNPDKHSWLERLKTVEVVQDEDEEGDALKTVVQPMPVVIDLSPFVRTADEITLEELDKGTYTAPINLPAACQKLYGNVAGAKIVLEDGDFPEFAEAIEYSCKTEGCWAFEKLKEKAGEFTPDVKGTYLRITLGYNLGDSPGIPYVLEIWPAGHYSPVHDHGNACAVIKVLHGSINCTWYDSLKQEPVEIGTANLSKGDVTWIGDNNFQIHMLHNTHAQTVCCTIQCYRYTDQDNVHYDGFNWVNKDKGIVELFTPNSDAPFLEFKAIMKAEWEKLQKSKA